MTEQQAMDSLMDSIDSGLQAELRRKAESDPGAFRDLTASFERFHEANPGIYATLCRLARQAQDHGHHHIGIAMLWEIMRWETLVGETKLGEGYKLNNNHRAFYARRIMEQERDLEGMFATRRQRSVA